MVDSPLLTKSKAFALEIIRICNEIKRSQKESILTNQLVRSGTSIGANIREAFYAHGKADFIAKLLNINSKASGEHCCKKLNIGPAKLVHPVFGLYLVS